MVPVYLGKGELRRHIASLDPSSGAGMPSLPPARDEGGSDLLEGSSTYTWRPAVEPCLNQALDTANRFLDK